MIDLELPFERMPADQPELVLMVRCVHSQHERRKREHDEDEAEREEHEKGLRLCGKGINTSSARSLSPTNTARAVATGR